MKIGIECEGRLKGLKTMFMDAAEAQAFFTYRSLKDATPVEVHAHIDAVRHIYISDHAGVLGPEAECLSIWSSLGMPVTIETTIIPPKRDHYPTNVTFFLTIESTSFWNLMPTDQVKFTRDLHVYTVTKETMPYTQPSEFLGDIDLCVDRDGTPKFGQAQDNQS